MRILFVLIALLVSCMSAVAQPAILEHLEQQYVNDIADIFTEQEELLLTDQLTRYEMNSTVEFAVVTVPDLEGYAIEEFSLAVAERLGVGKSDTDNGLLLLIAPNDRAYRFEVGYGLEGVLPDGRVGEIGRNVLVPAFSQSDYYTGTSEALRVAYAYAVDDPSIISEYHSTYGSQQNTTINITAIILLVIMLMIVFRGGFFPIFIPGGGFGGNYRGGNFGSGGFGGFGGGGFGGGGASGRW